MGLLVVLVGVVAGVALQYEITPLVSSLIAMGAVVAVLVGMLLAFVRFACGLAWVQQLPVVSQVTTFLAQLAATILIAAATYIIAECILFLVVQFVGTEYQFVAQLVLIGVERVGTFVGMAIALLTQLFDSGVEPLTQLCEVLATAVAVLQKLIWLVGSVLALVRKLYRTMCGRSQDDNTRFEFRKAPKRDFRTSRPFSGVVSTASGSGTRRKQGEYDRNQHRGGGKSDRPYNPKSSVSKAKSRVDARTTGYVRLTD